MRLQTQPAQRGSVHLEVGKQISAGETIWTRRLNGGATLRILQTYRTKRRTESHGSAVTTCDQVEKLQTATYYLYSQLLCKPNGDLKHSDCAQKSLKKLSERACLLCEN